MYLQTRGFPTWIDIYGEEACLSIEIINQGFDIIYNNSIKVNHRVDNAKRKAIGRNYFRFGKQLKNSAFYFLVYKEKPILPILKLFAHNFRKYAIRDRHYAWMFLKTTIEVVRTAKSIYQYRLPIDQSVFDKNKKLNQLQF